VRADAQAHIHTKRFQDVGCDDGNIVCCHQRVRKSQIGAGLRIEGKAAENFWQAVRGTGIGVGLGHESRRVARVTGGVDFSPSLLPSSPLSRSDVRSVWATSGPRS
jgi:hypothetical protein